VPSEAILFLTFENDTLRREKGRLIEVIDLARGIVGKVHGDAIIVRGKVGNGLEVGEGWNGVKFEGTFPTGSHPRTMAAWLKQTEIFPLISVLLPTAGQRMTTNITPLWAALYGNSRAALHFHSDNAGCCMAPPLRHV